MAGRRPLLVVALPALVATLIAGGLIAVAHHGGSGPTGVAPDPVVATVGADSIRRSQLDGRVVVVRTAALQGGAPTGAPGSSQGAAFEASIRARALRSLITDAVIAQEARARGVAASDADVEREVQASVSAAGGESSLETQLAGAGSSIQQLRDGTRARLNESQLEDLFARQRATDVLGQLGQGASFATLAAQYSDDDTSRPKGGDLGALQLDTLRGSNQAFVTAVSALAVGATTGAPVRDVAGYEILRVDAATASTRSVHRILVAAPQPYTEKERPQWFTQSVLLAIADDCTAGRIRVLIDGAGQPCGLGTGSPGATRATPTAGGGSGSPPGGSVAPATP